MESLSTPMNICKDYQVYLLRNAGGKTYIGLSENVTHRLEGHNAGKSKFTAKHKPWNLIWISGIMPLGEARKLENLLKRQKGGKGLQPLLDQHGKWVDLPV